MQGGICPVHTPATPLPDICQFYSMLSNRSAFKPPLSSVTCGCNASRVRFVRSASSNHTLSTKTTSPLPSSLRDAVEDKSLERAAPPMLNQLGIAAATVAMSAMMLHAAGAADAAPSFAVVADLAEVDAATAKLAQDILR